MKGSIGYPTQIVTVIPHLRQISRLSTTELSSKDKFMLKVFDWYYQKSPAFSISGKPDASLACRHFGIHRSYFYRLMARYDKLRLSSLKNKKTAPLKKRRPAYSRDFIAKVRKIRKDNPTYSCRKIHAILSREMDEADLPSAATIGRLIKRENLVFKPDIKQRKKCSKSAKRAHKRKRKHYGLKANTARQIIEFDMKHIQLFGVKLYAFCGIDQFTRDAVVHIASSPSSKNAKTAIKKIIARFGTGIKIINDNGIENMKDIETLLAQMNITQYWTRPYTPKYKPFIERFIGTLQRECLDYHYEPLNVKELSEITDAWLDKYHFYRPHEALGFLTLVQFSATAGVSIQTLVDVSYS